MNAAPVHAGPVCVRSGAYCLTSFDPLLAPLVTSWVQDAKELFWLAPKTPPPLTPEKLTAWPGPEGCPMVMYRQGTTQPVGYVELNPMPHQFSHLWMGHCLIRPDCRGMGLGYGMVELLLEEAFAHRGASAVSLVVFPQNVTAIRCYRSAGFIHVAEQIKFFATTGHEHCMLEMRITHRQYAAIQASHNLR